MKKRGRKNKIFKKVINVKYLPILAVLLVFCLSIGFSAFQETLLIEDMIANVTLVQNAQVTAAQVSSVTNNASSNYVEITQNTLSGSVVLPEQDSTVTYQVEVKNLDNVEVGLLDIESDNNDIEVKSTGDYTLGDKICDDTTPNKCNLGATKRMMVTVGYSENAYNAQTATDDKEFELSFDVENFVSITYVDISGSGYPDEIINGGTLEIDFDTNAPSDLTITMDGVTLSNGLYTYIDGVLTIPDVNGDIIVTGLEETTCAYTSSNAVNPFGNRCIYVDNDSSNSITVGDLVNCGTSVTDQVNGRDQKFYVIEDLNSGSTVKMITEWNLNIREEGNIVVSGFDLGIPYSYTYCADTIGYQDFHARGDLDYSNETSPYLKYITAELNGDTISDYTGYGEVKFDNVTTGSNGYWVILNNDGNHVLDTSHYTACSGESYCYLSYGSELQQYPSYVYDNNSTLNTFVNTYASRLSTALSTNVSGRLISFKELVNLGCDSDITNGTFSCSNAPNWVYQTSYWSGAAWNKFGIIRISKDDDQQFFYSNYFSTYGVRPVIEISSNLITLAP